MLQCTRRRNQSIHFVTKHSQNRNKKYSKAMKWWTINGEGVENYKEAMKWWSMAAEKGDTEAQFNLGVLYNRGNGVEKNFKEAVDFATTKERESRRTLR